MTQYCKENDTPCRIVLTLFADEEHIRTEYEQQCHVLLAGQASRARAVSECKSLAGPHVNFLFPLSIILCVWLIKYSGLFAPRII